MQINQEISNQLAGQVGKGGNPVFFERSINTEVVAESGQTILLGGLISEDSSNGNAGVPFLKSIPLLGALFESESKTNTKTELVIMMTPKIVERSSQWQAILNQYERALTNIAF
jgi:general secretion pathway protein D